MLSLLLGRIFAVWWSLTNQPCLHEGVPHVPRGQCMANGSTPGFTLRGHTVFWYR
jgi:hypothetical protein